jgi:hypothetical protein
MSTRPSQNGTATTEGSQQIAARSDRTKKAGRKNLGGQKKWGLREI